MTSYKLRSTSSLISSSVLCPKTFFGFVTNEIKYLNILFLVYLIFHLYIFQCAFFVILNFVLLRQVSFKIVRCAQALSHNFSITFLVLLVYNPKYVFKVKMTLWWAQMESNHRPHAYQACALTIWAMSPYNIRVFCQVFFL